MKNYWNQDINEIELHFQSSDSGLSLLQVSKAREQYGENSLKATKQKNIFQIFFSQFLDLLVIILIIAAGISMISGNVESTIVIILVLIINAVLGTIQHIQAQQSLNALKKLSSPSTTVIRDGIKISVPSSDIVPGDRVILETGDLIVADGRIVHNYSLQVNESSLTGESTNIDKNDKILEGDVALADRLNMVYSGSLVTYGRAEIIVTATGMNTEIGKIAELMNETKDRKTPLQVSLDQFSSKLAIIITSICLIVLGLCIYRDMPIIDSLMFAVALAVAAIPEALSSIVTIVQAIGTKKMAQENAIIKELKAVESLGCVSVICSDKTGTLTQNKMTVQKLFIENKELFPEEIDITKQSHRYLLYNAVLSNDSSIVDGKGIGDPTEYALLELFRKVPVSDNSLFQEGMHENHIRSLLSRKDELPFDSDRKLMSTKYLLHGVPTILTKGAVDVLIDRCTSICDETGVRSITNEDRANIFNQNKHFSEQGLRVLAFAYKESDEPLSIGTENNYVFIGLISMMDPPRPESIAAVADAKSAGIRTIMITGDHKITAVAIAKQIGIFEDGNLALTGMELDALSDDELSKIISKVSVYARVSPENKIRIVDFWQNQGNIVSMTGDGVNDAPALKKADIGVAMGITGTEVSKDAAAMILSDDNFATIIKAVANGRNVYRNIRNAILFLLSGNMAAIITVLYNTLLGLPIPFVPVHLLFINLLTDSLPAIAIGMEPADITLMKEKPRDPNEKILTKNFLIQILGQGSLIAIATIVAFYIGLLTNSTLASTMAFSTLTIARLFHGFNCRGKQSIFKLGLFSNKYSVFAFLGGIVLISSVICLPVLHSVFSVSSITVINALQILALAISPSIIIQIIKLLRQKSN